MTLEIVSKQEYARMRGRDPSAVSHWIRTGKLRPPALIGEGRASKVHVSLADRQLAKLLDLGQQLSQEKMMMAVPPDRKERQGELKMEVASPPSPTATIPIVTDPDQARRLKARADREEYETEMSRLKLRRESGQWVDIEEARREHSGRMSDLLNAFEGFIREQSIELASASGLDPRQIEASLFSAFRDFRVREAKRARDRVKKMQEAPSAPDDDEEDEEILGGE